MTLPADRIKTNQAPACRNLERFVRPNTALPKNVFAGDWYCYLFFESDKVFSGTFVGVAKELLSCEGSVTACLKIVSEWLPAKFVGLEQIRIDSFTTVSEYVVDLNGLGAVSNLAYMLRYACTSNLGGWCIFVDRAEDVAIIALRNKLVLAALREPLNRLWAGTLEVVSNEGARAVFPFTELTPEWRVKLAEEYATSNSEDCGP